MSKSQRWKFLMAPFLALIVMLGLYAPAFANSFASTEALTAGAVNARTNVALQGLSTINLKEGGPGHIGVGTIVMKLNNHASFKAITNIVASGTGDLAFTAMNNAASITCAAVAPADGDTITITRTNSDATTTTVTLEMDVAGNGVVAGNVAVTGLNAVAANNAAQIAAAINRDGTFYATDNGAGVVTVYNCGNVMTFAEVDTNNAFTETAGAASATKIDVTGSLVINVTAPSTVATTLIISGPQIETVGTSVGDEIKAYLDGSSSATGITTGVANGVVVANIVSGSTSSSVSVTKNVAVGLSNQTINDFIVKENIGNSLIVGNIDLTINTAGVTFTGVPAVANFVVTGGTTLAVNGAGATLLANNTILRIPVVASSAANTQGGTLTIKNIALTVANSASPGDLTINVSGTAQPTDEDVTVGKIVAIGTTSSVEGGVIKTNLLIRTNAVPVAQRRYSIANLIIKETAGASLLPNRNITIEAPAGIQFQDAGVATPSGSTLAIGASALNAARTEITIPVTASSATGSPGQIKVSSLELEVDQTLSTKDIFLHVAGNAGVTEENVKVAEANPATINTASEAPDVSIGVQSQDAANITITEQKKGALIAGNNINVTLPAGVTFAAKPTITVEQGNLTLGTNIADPTGGGVLSIPIATTSTVTSAIKISNIKITVDNTVPLGPVSVTFGGAAGPDITKVSIAKCTTGLISGILSSVIIEPATRSVAVNGTATVTAKGFDSQNNQLDLTGKTVTFTSDDPSIASVGTATVSGNVVTATVTGHKEGTCNISATIDGVTSGNISNVTVTAAVPSPASTSPTLDRQTQLDPTANSVNVTATEKTDVTIAPSLNVPKDDQGKSVNLYAGIVINNQLYLLKASSGLFGKTTFTWVHYTGGAIPSMGTATLGGATQAFDLDLNNINLTGFTGSFDVYYGYATKADLTDFVGSSYEVTVQ